MIERLANCTRRCFRCIRTASTLDHSGRPQKRSSHPKLQALTGTSYSCSVLESGFGPTLPTWALQQVVGYLRYIGRDANAVAKAARDPSRTWFGTVATCKRRDIGIGALSGRRDGLRAGIGALCQQHSHALEPPLRVGKRRIELQCLLEVSDRMVGIVLRFVDLAAGGIGFGIFRIKPDRLVEVGDRPVVVALLAVGLTAVVVGH